ncbi:MAG TPA: glycoside hydrolase family 38 C-terminal domain-containing protein, partial [Gaiellaceae bacterium]|nr:glycoside hydrolase family 38 C-terminal domain-containing protein [Gaiellaceae bacterium]
PLDALLVAGPVGRISYEEAQGLDYRPAELGERFGPLFATYWFRGAATVPAGWAGRRVDLVWDSASEATLWLEGQPVQGLNRHHPDAPLAAAAVPGRQLTFDVELACNGMFGKQDAAFELRRAELAAFDPDAWRLYFDFETLRALEAADGVEPSLAGQLRAGLEQFCDDGDAGVLARLYEHVNGSHAHEVSAIGHAHIDTAWLWPLAESYRKAVRTFTTQLRYLDEYPDYRFACSQAVQYAWIEERDPLLWERLRSKVSEGRFVPVGGSWVEPDCNLPSGEALLRHFLYGQRFFESRFGRRCTDFWSPDAFGYNGQLPQLLQQVGISRFLTQKLSWNRFNRPEHHTFTWQGVDGSEVLGHFPPADTYSSDATVPELLKTVREYKDHDRSGRSLLVFGYGDGGGGPTRAMLETLRRAADLQGVPRTHMTTSDEFFSGLEEESGERPVVVGELYFEYHRGVYTTQARTKRLNRRCEQALHDAEFISCLRGGEYPRAELDRLWKGLLLNQFHDILPGSSIRQVHEESERDLGAVLAGAEALCGAGETPLNTIGWPRREVATDPSGQLRFVEAPPYAAGTIVQPEGHVSIRQNSLVLENEHLRAELSPEGTLVGLVDKASGRDALAAPGNRLELYDDDPVQFDAWDIDPAHLRTRRDVAPASSHEVVTESPLRVELAFDRAHGIRQVVRLDAGSRRLEFRTTVDWRERKTLLKVCFPLAVRAPTATYEMPFGYAERPTHYSTSWDRARYEVPGHRFADLSEHGFGVALLTDSKYGYSCFGNELRISLLRSPVSPDPEADQGAHEFAYAILPHVGGWREAGVLAEAHRFNAPLRWIGRASVSQAQSLASVDDANLVLDTIKRAEDSDALVLRLYEAHGARGTARLRVTAPFSSARLANGLEDAGDALETKDGEILIQYRPHQLLTVKVA